MLALCVCALMYEWDLRLCVVSLFVFCLCLFFSFSFLHFFYANVLRMLFCVMQARVVYARIVCPRAFILRVGLVIVCGEFLLLLLLLFCLMLFVCLFVL